MEEKELIEKYGINIEALRKEQIKLAKSLITKDCVDFNLAAKFGAIENIMIGNKIISVIIVCDKNYNILEQQYFSDKLRFPYLTYFRSYREVPAMVEAYNKLQDKPDVVFIHGHGITHPFLGIASHFAIITGVPTIGISGDLFKESSIEGENIKIGNKIVGKIFQSKEKANPLYISSGNSISLDSAYNLVKNSIKLPHKLPEPLHLAHKYAKSVKEELNL